MFYRKRLEKMTRLEGEMKDKLEQDARGAKASAHKWKTSAMKLEHDMAQVRA